jgi:hypothetical protein
VNEIQVAQARIRDSLFGKVNERRGCINRGEFIEELSKNEILNRDCVP